MKPTPSRGFTLLEISIVLVIIGLLLGGVLAGQGLIRSMRVKDAIAMYEDLRTATVYFRQRYNFLPGDYPTPVGDIPNVTAPATGVDGNGEINGVIDPGTGTATPGDEIAEAPWHLYNAGFIGKIDTNNPAMRLRSAFGAVHLAGIAVTDGLVPGYLTANPTVQNTVVFFNLPCDVVAEMDIKLDNGDPATGKAMSSGCVNDVVAWYAVAL